MKQQRATEKAKLAAVLEEEELAAVVQVMGVQQEGDIYQYSINP